MSLLVILPPLFVALHLLCWALLRRGQPGRRLLGALLIIALAYPLQFLGVYVGLDNDAQFGTLTRLCLFAPALLSVLSLLVYVPVLFKLPSEPSPEPAAPVTDSTDVKADTASPSAP